MRYRAHIDGLRAIAVLAIVIYHFGLPGLAGGYLGVDVFFTISGYLVCGMIVQDLEAGKFSLAAFYGRRVIRILPGLIVMLLVTGALAYAYFLPVELTQFAQSLVSAAFFVSNVYFAKTAGYFDGGAEMKPLLHSWSLGVEAQFYLACPLFLLLAFRLFRTRVGLMLLVCAALSFVADVLMSARNPQLAFYLSPFRAWELIGGGLVAIGFFPRFTQEASRNAAGLLGLGLVALSLVLAAPHLPHPLVALAACVGSMLVIASGESGPSPLRSLLSCRPLVFVGLISYSLYLWHWPLLVFQHTDGVLLHDASDLAGKTMLIVLSLALAVLSWRLVETPFRGGWRKLEMRRVFAGAGAAVTAVVVLAALPLSQQGAPHRFSGKINHLASYLGYDPSRAFREGHCFLSTNRQSLDEATCLRRSAAKPNYLLVGDSHAAHLWLGLSEALPNVNVMQASVSMCRPVLPPIGTVASTLDTRKCPQVMRYIFNDYLAREPVDKVLMAGAWKEEDLPRLAETLNSLTARGADVVVMGPIIEYDRPLPRLLTDVLRYGDPDRPKASRAATIPPLDRALRKLVEGKGASYVSVYDAVCSQEDCDTFARPEVPLQFDAGHLTAEGSLKVGETLVRSAALR
jgi:peptidoglycan/LPS O-acetylase OafA/YrhL